MSEPVVEAPIDLVEVTWDNVENFNIIDAAVFDKNAEPAQEKVEAVDVAPDKVESEPEVKEEVVSEKPESKEILDLKDDSEISVKIDGKEEKVSLKDLKANYSGKVAYDRKFSEVDKQNKQVLKDKANLQQEIDTVNSYVNTFAAKMKNSDAVGAMSYLAEFSGMSPAAMKQALINQLLPEINRQANLTDSERDLEYTKEEIAYQKANNDRELQKLQKENSQKSSELANAKLRAEKGVSDTEWEEAFSFLDAHVEKDKAITRNDVVDYAIWKRADNRSTAALSEYDSGKHLNDKSIRDTLTKIASENPDFTKTDLNDVLKEAFRGKAEEIVKKVAVSKNVQAKPRDEKGKFSYSSQALTSWD